MSTILFVGLLLATACALYVLKPKRTSKQRVGQRASKQKADSRKTNKQSVSEEKREFKKPKQWHAVSLRAGRESCESISLVHDKVYLSNEAPTLPLSSCEQADCRCRYEHFADRRQSLRRDPYSQYGLQAALHHQGKERRSARRGRREADLASA